MAEILDFRAGSGRMSRRPAGIAAKADAGGEVVIFPGVRYERWDTAQAMAEKPKAKPRRIKRDTLELKD